MTRPDPMPELCRHDDPSWCSAECEEKARKFDAWIQQRVSAERQAYSELIKIAAELVRCSYMPSEDYSDHPWLKSTPLKERRRIVKENEKACLYNRGLAMRLKAAADTLMKTTPVTRG